MIFTVSGDGFLYNMVRIMVGTLIFINEGKIGRNSNTRYTCVKGQDKRRKRPFRRRDCILTKCIMIKIKDLNKVNDKRSKSRRRKKKIRLPKKKKQ